MRTVDPPPPSASAFVESTSLGQPELEALLLLLFGGLLIASLVLVRKLSAVLPMSRSRREAWLRLRPVLAIATVLAYLGFCIRVLLRYSRDQQVVTLTLLLLLFCAAAWFAIRDVVAGTLLKAARLCRVGDQVAVGEHQGRVGAVGIRSITIETSTGEEAVVPFSQLSRSAILRKPVVEGGALHVFQIQSPASASLDELRRGVTESALCSHWSSTVRAPTVKALGGDHYEVTVFALHPDYVAEIEAAVRRSPILAASG